MTKKRIISGIQTSGKLHLGNYLGSIKQWIDMQDEYESLFFLADLHSITVKQAPKDLLNNSLDILAIYLAAGIDPKKTTIFAQSTVSTHAELAWILSCITSIGWMNRMTQFKEKAGKDREQASLGLYNYPVLMAADILAYNVDLVPVGEDQRQHLELTRDIAAAFNRYTGVEYFKLPQAKILKEAARIMSLRDGLRKMSKSDPSDYARINLADDAETILKKIQKATTDSQSHVSFDPENRPEISNLVNIFAVCSGQTTEQIVKEYEGAGFAKFKSDLAEAVITSLSPLKSNFDKIRADQKYLTDVLKSGQEKALSISVKHFNEIKNLLGFISLGSI